MNETDSRKIQEYLLNLIYPTSKFQYSAYFSFLSSVYQNSTELIDNSYLLYNATSLYSIATSLTFYDTMLLKHLTNDTNAQIVTHNHPFPGLSSLQTILATLPAIFISIAFAFIPAPFIYYLVQENELKFKHLQYTSGVNFGVYCFSNFCWDLINYSIPAIMCFILILVFDIKEFVGENLVATISILIEFGFSIVSFSHLSSYFFQNKITAQNTMFISFMITGVFLVISSNIMEFLPKTLDINEKLRFLYRCFPSFALGS